MLKLRGATALLAGLVALAACAASILLMPDWRETLRENAFDLVLLADHRLRTRAETTPRVVVVDIDRRTLDTVGAWPWPRETTAEVVAAIAAAGPAAIGIDILFEGSDAHSPAALARKLAELTGKPELKALSETLADGDKLLVAAAAGAPLALGFVLDPDRPATLPPIAILLRPNLELGTLWGAYGATGPPPLLLQAARGLGTISLPDDLDGVVRRVPLLVNVGGRRQVGFAIELVRLAQQANALLVEGKPLRLRAGNVSIGLAHDALLRLAPADRPATISVADLMGGKVERERLTGAIVLLGGSAPELGGSKATASDPATPSVQIQADAVRQILAGRSPRAVAEPWNRLAFAALGLLAIALGSMAPPLVGALAILGASALACVGAVSLSLTDRLFDPLTPSLAAAITFTVTSVVSFAEARRREARIRQRFTQYLAPAVVDRIARNPALVKLTGERREVTALFSDVESFTAMTHRAEPEQLVAVLDDYFEGLARIVTAHGGMIDKIMGDGLHAMFNAPLDLPDHARHAVDCAVAMRDWVETFRQRPLPQALGFGRTRIGVETGPAIVGEIGLEARLAYTAHGDAVNLAARLEAANKELGSTICVGPVAAARCDPARFRPLGTMVARGREGEDAVAVFEPWPQDASPDWRARYAQAFALSGTDRAAAIARLEALAAERPDDPVPVRMAARLRAV